WKRSLRAHRNYWVETPGFRSKYGPFLLSSYHYGFSEKVEGILDMDYRQKRGFGYGPGLGYDLGRWGKGEMRYYRAQDEDPGLDLNSNPIPDERQRGYLQHVGTPFTNLTVRAALRYQSDQQFIRDYFEKEYRDNVQPSTFLEVQKSWRNWSLNVMGQGQVNDFHQTIERLPDVKFTGLRQQLGETPLFYESESSFGYFRRRYGTAGLDGYGAMRADTFHQILLPKTYFNWLNVTPRVGSRGTHYGEVDGRGSPFNERDRYVFNTGAEFSTKASRVWSGARNRFFEIDGLRHIVEPSLNYAFVPTPSRIPRELPQFDYEIPSRRLLPINYPDYNAIDSVDSQNVVRMGLRNRLQTRRDGQSEDVVSWALYSDWRLHPKLGQGTYSDLYSDLDLAPFRWLELSSELRYSLDDGDWKEANHHATITPNNVWSVGVGHRYFRDDPLLGVDSGHNLFSTRFYYRLSENWGFRSVQHFEARDGTMEEQAYSVYRDFRSWTGVITFRVREGWRNEPTDYAVVVAFNFKASPRFKRGSDINEHSPLLY
ncbi:MAG: LPS-assembly protein LptD, partial [Verrucomicrobia bacterium]|nr:LPS-assembly protein LptD [Verrucomicrobiota bacterium]